MERKTELVVEEAGLTLGTQPVLRGVDLAVGRGEVVALLGASGCGKTTLLRAIAGLASLDQGRIALAGRDVTGLPARERGIGVVFQHYALFPNLSVLENVKFGVLADGHSQAEADRRALTLLGMVELDTHRDKRPARLSGGQRQRVALARALARQPSLLLMDEPFSALDESFRIPLRRSFRRLQRTLDQTCLLVTHDREEAFELADRVAVMFDGRIAQFSAPSELWRRPRTRQVAEFLGAFNLLDARSAPGALRRDRGTWAAPVSALRLSGPEGIDAAWRIRAQVVESHFGPHRIVVELRSEAGVDLTLWRAHAAGPMAAGEWIDLCIDADSLQWLED